MKKRILIATLLSLWSIPLFAQHDSKITGLIMDSASNSKISGATVAVLNARDSILESFAYTGRDGLFMIDGLEPGSYQLLVSYHEYVDYVELFFLQDREMHQFRQINIQPRFRLLAEVLVKGNTSAIRIKSDTTEFNAKAFVIQPNDKVEDRLRQLPGIQIDKEGKIKAQGYTISKVLVDREEFFGDDPTLVTKNLRADMVSKVQLFDKKSEQADFTGIDDGKRTKTINIKLKEDKKNGVFGKIDLGVGTKDFYQGQGFYNKFRNNEKMSVYGTMANTGKTGLGFIENGRLGTTNIQLDDNGAMPVPTNGDLDAASGRYDGRGLPSAKTGGLHYDNKWDDNKLSLNSNYGASYLDITGGKNSNIQQSLPSGIINSTSYEKSNNSTFRQKFDVAIQTSIDTLSSIKLTADAMFRNFKTGNDYTTLAEREDATFLNKQLRSLSSDGNQRQANVLGLYTRKFRKPRRTLSRTAAASFNGSVASGYLRSLVDFYNPLGSLDSSRDLSQSKKK